MSEPTSVYQYFDRGGRLLYVGVTKRGVKRTHEHADSKAWWPLVAGSSVEHFADRPAALEREASLIHRHRPPYNTVHNPSGGVVPAAIAERAAAAQAWPVSLKERRRQWYLLSPEEKKIAPCIGCGERPGCNGPMCFPCFDRKSKPTSPSREEVGAAQVS